MDVYASDIVIVVPDLTTIDISKDDSAAPLHQLGALTFMKWASSLYVNNVFSSDAKFAFLPEVEESFTLVFLPKDDPNRRSLISTVVCSGPTNGEFRTTLRPQEKEVFQSPINLFGEVIPLPLIHAMTAMEYAESLDPTGVARFLCAIHKYDDQFLGLVHWVVNSGRVIHLDGCKTT